MKKTFIILFLFATQLFANVVIDFDDVNEWRDFEVYYEDGFILDTHSGTVRINDFVTEGNMSAQPSFGFGQGKMRSKFIFKQEDNLEFDFLSIDVVEATLFPEEFGLEFVGYQDDLAIISQVIYVDGISGFQTFEFLNFKNLTSLRIIKPYDDFYVSVLKIDNIIFNVPEPLTSTALLVGMVYFLRKRDIKGVRYLFVFCRR